MKKRLWDGGGVSEVMGTMLTLVLTVTLFSTLMRVGGQALGENRWPAHSTARWDY